MTRQTSIEVYNQIKSEGLLSKRRWQVYEALFKNGPLTQMETSRIIGGGTLDHSISPRFAELNRYGVIKTIGERFCKITGRKVLIWDITNELPIKFDKPKRQKCSHCKGTGYVETTQARLL